jgi:hypothetical protein
MGAHSAHTILLAARRGSHLGRAQHPNVLDALDRLRRHVHAELTTIRRHTQGSAPRKAHHQLAKAASHATIQCTRLLMVALVHPISLRLEASALFRIIAARTGATLAYLLVTEDGEALLECQLEPVEARDPVPRPVVEVLVRNNPLDPLKIRVRRCRWGAGRNL